MSVKDFAYAFPIRPRRHHGMRFGRGRLSGQRGQTLERAGGVIYTPTWLCRSIVNVIMLCRMSVRATLGGALSRARSVPNL
jgi:hypothetical protein